MFRFYLRFAALVLVLCLSAPVWADTIEATVTRITGSDLELVLTDSNRQPKPGDSVDIAFPVPGGGRISIGVWRVTSVEGRKVFVSVVRNSGQPAVGYLATIQTSQQSASTVSAPPRSPVQNAPAGADHTAAWTTDQLSTEEQRLISELRSANTADKRRAAMTIHRSFLRNKTLQAVIEEELLKGYATRTRDRSYIDAMAWMCNVLGDSGDRSYSATLKKVYQGTRNRKVKKFARANYQKVR